MMSVTSCSRFAPRRETSGAICIWGPCFVEIDGWTVILHPEWRARRINPETGDYESRALRIPPGFDAMTDEEKAAVVRECLRP